MRHFAAARSRPWATRRGARIAHLAAKCCQMLPNAAKMLVNFFLTDGLSPCQWDTHLLPPHAENISILANFLCVCLIYSRILIHPIGTIKHYRPRNTVILQPNPRLHRFPQGALIQKDLPAPPSPGPVPTIPTVPPKAQRHPIARDVHIRQP